MGTKNKIYYEMEIGAKYLNKKEIEIFFSSE
jgi:hypothetical protein